MMFRLTLLLNSLVVEDFFMSGGSSFQYAVATVVNDRFIEVTVLIFSGCVTTDLRL